MQTLSAAQARPRGIGRSWARRRYLSHLAVRRRCSMSEKEGQGRLMTTRIIIADHSELFARGVAELLGARGYEVLGIASTGDEVVKLAADHPEGLVLVDESIDGEGAAALIRGLLRKNPRQPAIVMNGSWDLSRGRPWPRRRSRRGDRQELHPRAPLRRDRHRDQRRHGLQQRGGGGPARSADRGLRSRRPAQHAPPRAHGTGDGAASAPAHVDDTAADRGQAFRLAQDDPEQRLVALSQAGRSESA